MYDFNESILCYTREWALCLLRMNWRKARRSTKVKMERPIPAKTEEARIREEARRSQKMA